MNQDDLIAKYYSLLAKWNEKMSLVSSARDEAEFRAKHVDDALELIPFLSNARTVLDLGTGAGIPGIIIKIARPDIELTLLDSIRKKVSFCDEVIRRLGLDHIKAVCGRAEDDHVRTLLGRFDAIVSRATWQIEKYLTISTCYLNKSPSSRLIAMKGPSWRSELNAAKSAMQKLGVKLVETYEYELKGGERRCILAFGVKSVSS